MFLKDFGITPSEKLTEVYKVSRTISRRLEAVIERSANP
jgi:hypothetical protein